MPLLDDTRFQRLLSELPEIPEEASRLMVAALRRPLASRSDLQMDAGDWADEVITLISDARYFLAMAIRAWEIGYPFTFDENGEMHCRQEFEEHRRFCWAALVLSLSALDKLAQMVNLHLELGANEKSVSAAWLERSLHGFRAKHVEWYQILSGMYKSEHVQRARGVRNCVVHRQNPLTQVRVSVEDDRRIEIEFGRDWLGPEALQQLVLDLLSTMTSTWTRITGLRNETWSRRMDCAARGEV